MDDRTGGGETAPRLPVHLRFDDLKTSRIVNSWQTLKRLINEQNFPPGRLASPNTRLWTYDEVMDWLNSRPTKPKSVPNPWPDRRRERERERKAKVAAKAQEAITSTLSE
jgi:hypothetical protein